MSLLYEKPIHTRWDKSPFLYKDIKFECLTIQNEESLLFQQMNKLIFTFYNNKWKRN